MASGGHRALNPGLPFHGPELTPGSKPTFGRRPALCSAPTPGSQSTFDAPSTFAPRPMSGAFPDGCRSANNSRWSNPTLPIQGPEIRVAAINRGLRANRNPARPFVYELP